MDDNSGLNSNIELIRERTDIMCRMTVHKQLENCDWLTTASDADLGMALRSVDEPDRTIIDVARGPEEIIITAHRDDREMRLSAVEIDRDPRRIVDINGAVAHANRIQEMREAADFSCADLADRLDITEHTVWAWENRDGHQPSRENAARLDDVFRE